MKYERIQHEEGKYVLEVTPETPAEREVMSELKRTLFDLPSYHRISVFTESSDGTMGFYIETGEENVKTQRQTHGRPPSPSIDSQ
jgi:hypothetical protein